MEKSPSAFRTIGEVSDELGIAQHVLRYWETRFPQVKPVTRAGNRRYYRPSDVALLRRIQTLLSQEGYTVKGVQRLLMQEAPADVLPPPPAVPEGPGESAPLEELLAIRALLAAALETAP